MDGQSELVVITAVLVGINFLWFARSAGTQASGGNAHERTGDASDRNRIQRADDARERISPAPRYAVSGIGFAVAIVVAAHVVPPAVGYAMLCLALAGRCVADQVAEERAPRRRAALVGRSRRVDPVLLTWIGLSAASSLLLVPWMLDNATRASAILVELCVVAMLVVAWRVASAPLLLFGGDLEAEQVVDRETRVNRTGNACFVAVAAVSVSIGFIGAPSPTADYRYAMVLATLALCGVLVSWKSIYARRLARTPLAS